MIDFRIPWLPMGTLSRWCCLAICFGVPSLRKDSLNWLNHTTKNMGSSEWYYIRYSDRIIEYGLVYIKNLHHRNKSIAVTFLMPLSKASTIHNSIHISFIHTHHSSIITFVFLVMPFLCSLFAVGVCEVKYAGGGAWLQKDWLFFDL